MLLSAIDASVLEWFCALSGQYHSLTDGSYRNYFHLLRERKIILPLSGAAQENNQAYIFFSRIFLVGFDVRLKNFGMRITVVIAGLQWPQMLYRTAAHLSVGTFLLVAPEMGSENEWISRGQPNA